MNIKKVSLFLAITFMISWLLMLLLHLIVSSLYTDLGGIFVYFFMLVPGLSAIIVQKLIFKEKLELIGLKPKFNKYIFLAWLLPIGLMVLIVTITNVFLKTTFNLDYSNLFNMIKPLTEEGQFATIKAELPKLSPVFLILYMLTFAVASTTMLTFGEEAGWRGLLYSEFRSLGFIRASLLIGSIWGIWHLPLMLMGHIYPEHRILGVFLMIIWCILLTPILIFLRYKTKSILSSAVFHASINILSMIGFMFIFNGNELSIGYTGIPGLIILFLMDCVLIFCIRKNKNVMMLEEKT